MAAGPGSTIGEVAARTGVTVATLRAWERRFGFPQPQRGGGGHRRFAPDEVARIEQVVRDRSSGLSLEAAIERARERGGAEGSLYSGLRRARPDLVPQVLSRRAMLAMSRAIEDECRSAGDRPVVLAAFQRAEAFRVVAARWRDLARAAAATVVFADFPATRDVDGIIEVAAGRADPLAQEWAVVCHGPLSAACLVGRERLVGGRAAPGRPGFEAVWSAEPEAVATAARLACDQVRRVDVDLADRVAGLLAAVPVGEGGDAAALRRTTSLAGRAVALLDRSV